MACVRYLFPSSLRIAALALVLPITQLSANTVVVGEVRITIDHNTPEHANPGFYFSHVLRPSVDDAATSASFSIIQGEPARGGGIETLHDGKLPGGTDSPGQNFFFEHGTDGGLVRIDLGRVIGVQMVNTYSCHPSTRAPQIYTLYASNGEGTNLVLAPRRGDDMAKAGWKFIASVETSSIENSGGQWAVSISGEEHVLGPFRYLLFDVHRTEADDPFGNTFYSEIDVISDDSAKSRLRKPETVQERTAGPYKLTISSANAPELTEWAQKVLGPIAEHWYPKISALLASDGFETPMECKIEFRDLGPVSGAAGQTVAYSINNRIICGSEWFRQNLSGESAGTVIHEMVHVIQQYSGDGAGTNPTPSWLVEGLADYIRWFLFEPQVHGAEITQANFPQAKYDSSYRISANFLNWVVEKHGKQVLSELNAAARKGQYNSGLWSKLTGHSVEELGKLWRAAVAASLGMQEQ